MLHLDLVLASILIAPAGAPPPEAAPVQPPPEAAPAGEPLPEAAPAGEPLPEVAPAGEPLPEVAPVQPLPEVAPAGEPLPEVAPVQPLPEVAPVNPPPAQPPTPNRRGLGMMIAGPLLVLAGVPFSLMGNALWRDKCGPNSPTRQCADGTLGSIGMHTLAAGAYGGGIILTGLGAERYANHTGTPASAPGYVGGGAIVMPIGLMGMIVARVLFWGPTPKCVEYSCVRSHQTRSTLTVGAGALVAAAGAGMLMYGLGSKHAPRRPRVSFSPRFGRGLAGLELMGRF